MPWELQEVKLATIIRFIIQVYIAIAKNWHSKSNKNHNIYCFASWYLINEFQPFSPGLTYLHTFSERCVIHRDVKSSNILLDQSMTAKVADFGFSKYAPQEGDSGTSLEVRGTAGYLDPE